MADEVEKCNINSDSISIDTHHIKVEYESDDYLDGKTCILESIISANNTKVDDCVKEENKNIIEIATADNIKTEPKSPEMCRSMINDDIKIEDEIGSAGVMKLEFNNKPLLCNNCQEYYRDYCTKCGMLIHILNGPALSGADDKAQEQIPMGILEIRFLSGQFGVFALKTIPEGVRFGRFTGLSTSECSRKIKGGRFMVDEDESKILNWMQYINPAKNSSEQNLFVFQCRDDLYYSSIRDVQVGDELLVYFGEEYEDSRNRDTVMDFIAHTENDTKDVFACTYCCLGFSSREYLAKHKSICRNGTSGKFSIEELIQCPLCHIYLGEMEYLEYHFPHCCKENDRKCVSLVSNNKTIEIRERRTQRHHTYTCTQCNYETAHKEDLKSHVDKHYDVKMYKCGICRRRFKTKGNLKRHVKKIHVDVDWDDVQKYSVKAKRLKVHHDLQDEAKPFGCLECNFRTKYKHNLKNHMKTYHLKEFDHGCGSCKFRTNQKRHLEIHMKTKHLKQFKYKCRTCDYRTRAKSYLLRHLKVRHFKEFNYECEMCEYKTNRKSKLEDHVNTNHLREFKYKCESCTYETNRKWHLEIHMKTTHVKEFSYKCKTCDYKTNDESNLERHVKTQEHLKKFNCKADRKLNLDDCTKTKHPIEFDHKCEMCTYKTNDAKTLEMHIKSKHPKQFKYKCEMCEYNVYQKAKLEIHVKTKHLKKFDYCCETCDYKTNIKSNLTYHVKRRHHNGFGCCCEMCDYKTNVKSNLDHHVKTKHLKKFDYCCETCDYKTNVKSNLDHHVKSKHLKNNLNASARIMNAKQIASQH